MMNTRSLTPEQRFELIMDCKNSGLTDYQWCQEHDINPGTFYNWISRFRKAGYPNIPKTTNSVSSHKVQPQEVVKINILPEPNNSSFDLFNEELEGKSINPNNTKPALEIIHNGSVFKISNNINPQLLDIILLRIGDVR